VVIGSSKALKNLDPMPYPFCNCIPGLDDLDSVRNRNRQTLANRLRKIQQIASQPVIVPLKGTRHSSYLDYVFHLCSITPGQVAWATMFCMRAAIATELHLQNCSDVTPS